MDVEQSFLRVKEWMKSYKIKVYRLINDGFILISRGEDIENEGTEELYKRSIFYTYLVADQATTLKKWEKVRLSSDKLHGQLRKILTRSEYNRSKYGMPKEVQIYKNEIKYLKILYELSLIYDFHEIDFLKPIAENE